MIEHLLEIEYQRLWLQMRGTQDDPVALQDRCLDPFRIVLGYISNNHVRESRPLTAQPGGLRQFRSLHCGFTQIAVLESTCYAKAPTPLELAFDEIRWPRTHRKATRGPHQAILEYAVFESASGKGIGDLSRPDLDWHARDLLIPNLEIVEIAT